MVTNQTRAKASQNLIIPIHGPDAKVRWSEIAKPKFDHGFYHPSFGQSVGKDQATTCQIFVASQFLIMVQTMAKSAGGKTKIRYSKPGQQFNETRIYSYICTIYGRDLEIDLHIGGRVKTIETRK